MRLSTRLMTAPAALVLMTLAACGDNNTPVHPTTVPPAVTNPATPVEPLPAAQEQSSTTPNPADPTDGQAIPPTNPPPVLPPTPPT